MKKRKQFIRVTCIFLVLLMLLSLVASVITVRAVSQEEIDALQEEKQALEAKSQALQDKVNSMEKEQSRYLDRKAVLDEKIACTGDEIAVIQKQVELYAAQISETGAQLELAKKSEGEQFELLRSRMRSMEESGTISYVNVLLNANSLSDFLGKVTDISEIMHYDQNLQAEYVNARENVQLLNARLEEAQERQCAIQEELTLKQEQMEAQTVVAYEMIAAIENDLDTYGAELEANEQAEAALQKDIDALMAKLAAEEAARKAAEEAARRASQQAASASTTPPAASSVGATGTYKWPVDCYIITSEYGYRVHPLQQTTKFHAGVDIGAQSGQAIYAADTGTVATAATNSSYGNYVLINHGGGNATLYAHMSSMAVSAGQSVTKGQVIGYVGSTGWSTGPHLHFEIRQGGSTVNPLQFFSGYTIVD